MLSGLNSDSMRNLRETKEGLILSIKVTPCASKNEIVGWKDGWLRIKVCAAPEKGKANQAVVHLLAKTFKLSHNKIVLLRGENARKKEFLLLGYTQLEFDRLGFEEKGENTKKKESLLGEHTQLEFERLDMFKPQDKLTE